MKFAKYDKYKPSKIEWIGEIPENWMIKKLSHGFGKIGSGTTPTSGDMDYYLDGEYNWLQTGDLNDNEIYFTSKKITKKALETYSTLRFYGVNSIVIAMYGATIGKMGILKIETTTNQACCVLSSPQVFFSKYVFFWFLANRSIVISWGYGGGQPNISQDLIKSIRVPCPSLPEQTAIASFLDEKTSQIDNLISNKQKLIELLKEERSAVINNAITKGIDPNVEMKPSGIEWLGDIPQHWQVKKLKYVANLRDELIEDSDLKIAVENIEGGTGKLINISEEKMFEGSLSKFLKGDIVFNKLRPYLHKVYYAENNGGLYGELLVLYTKGEVISELLYYILFSKSFIDLVDSSTQGTKMPRANWNEFISQQLIPFSKDEFEQRKIINHIKEKTSKIGAIISKIEREIELMKEYRNALISEAVTGKIKVN